MLSQSEQNVLLEMLADIEKLIPMVVAAEEEKLPAPYNMIAPSIVSPVLSAFLSKIDSLVKEKISAASSAPVAPAAAPASI